MKTAVIYARVSSSNDRQDTSRKCDLNGNLLTCRRRKTGTELCIRVTPEAMALIERYGNHDEHSPYLLNLLGSNPDGEEDFHQYRSNLRGLDRKSTRLNSSHNA